MTLNEYIHKLIDLLDRESGDLVVIDAYENGPGEPEAQDGYVILADKF